MATLIQHPHILPLEQCPLCRSTHRRILYGGRDDRFPVVRCNTCDLVHAMARYHPRSLEQGLYQDNAQPPDTSLLQRKRRSVALYNRLLHGRLLPPLIHSKALDIGCHNGALLDVFQSLGFRTQGIERAPNLARIARQRHHVYEVDVAVPGLMLGESFDVITMTHVLEHLTRPMATLRFMAHHLNPGGVVIIEVPNWADLARPLWGRHYRPLELGDHVAFYERDTLRRALEYAGLRVCALWSQPQGASLVMPSLLSASDFGRGLLNRLRPKRWSETRQPDVVSRAPTPPIPAYLRHSTLAALDRLDPWLERLAPSRATWGANLIAIASLPPELLH